MEVRVLGQLEVLLDGRPVVLDAAKPRTLLAILAMHAGTPVARDRLIEDLWAGRPPGTAAKVLQTYVSRLRKHLGADAIRTGAAGYELAIDPDSLDAMRFERLVASSRSAEPATAARTLREALALWRGPALADFAYEPWAQPEIGRLEELRLGALQDRIDADLALGAAGLVPEIEALVAAHPLSERLRGQLMLALYRAGRQADALAEYHRARGTLVETLGIEPGTELRRLEHMILAHDPALEAAPAPPAAPPRRPAPRPPTSFVGRARELDDVLELLVSPDVRLLTLTGPGGSGKTRLALEATMRLQDAFADGVTFVDLTAVADAGLVAGTIADRLGVGERPGEARTDSLIAALSERTALLVLDNLEHLVGVDPLLVEILSRAPGTTLAVTSRSPVGIVEERIYPVPVLELPDATTSMQLDRLRQVEAVQLFVERARDVRPDFELTEANARAVADLCARLDGLPLALELAAARTALLSPQAILDRLGNRLARLRAAPGTGMPERHRTLGAATQWSYELLSEDDRRLFTSLAVFAGGFDIEAAEAVACDAEGDVVDGVESLLSDSLLRSERIAGGEPRFGMLGTIREYALERLAERGAAEEICRRHASYYADLAEAAEPALLGPDQVSWLDRLDAELANIRAAMSWSAETGEVETGLRIGAALWRFWQLRGLIAEARGILEELLKAAGGSVGARATACARVASLAQMEADWESARAFGEAALPDLRRLRDDSAVASHLTVLVITMLATGDLDRAREYGEESLELARRSGDAMACAYAQMTLGAVLAQAGELDEAERLLSQSVLGARRLGNVRSVAMWSRMVGNVALARGDRERARTCFEESLELGRTLADAWAVSRALSRLAALALDDGEEEEARRLAAESIAIEREVGDRVGQLLNLEVFAALAVAAGQPGRAARLYGAASVIRESFGTQDWPDREPDIADIRRALGEATFDAEWAAGRELGLEESLELALATDSAV